MSIDKGAKSAQPKSIINRYGSGWGVPPGIERGTKLTAKEQKNAEKSCVRVQSYVENLLSRGRYRPR